MSVRRPGRRKLVVERGTIVEKSTRGVEKSTRSVEKSLRDLEAVAAFSPWPQWQVVTETRDHQWSMVTDRTERLAVPGGWLYWRTQREMTHSQPRSALVFVPERDK